jgi:hypothetical protein
MSNYSDNKKAIDQFQKELKAMLGDISKIDEKVLNRALNEGVAFAKRHTPVGLHPNPVTFTVKNGPDVGKIVSFTVKNPVTGGFLRKSWSKERTKKSSAGVEAELVNTAEYASYWNDGHRIVNKKGGKTKGFVKGTKVLENTIDYVDGRMADLFEKEVKAVQKKYDR